MTWWMVLVIEADGGTTPVGPYRSEAKAEQIQAEILADTDADTHVAVYPMARWTS